MYSGFRVVVLIIIMCSGCCCMVGCFRFSLWSSVLLLVLVLSIMCWVWIFWLLMYRLVSFWFLCSGLMCLLVSRLLLVSFVRW